MGPVPIYFQPSTIDYSDKGGDKPPKLRSGQARPYRTMSGFFICIQNLLCDAVATLSASPERSRRAIRYPLNADINYLTYPLPEPGSGKDLILRRIFISQFYSAETAAEQRKHSFPDLV